MKVLFILMFGVSVWKIENLIQKSYHFIRRGIYTFGYSIEVFIYKLFRIYNALSTRDVLPNLRGAYSNTFNPESMSVTSSLVSLERLQKYSSLTTPP
jgi:hypothetical protein